MAGYTFPPLPTAPAVPNRDHQPYAFQSPIHQTVEYGLEQGLMFDGPPVNTYNFNDAPATSTQPQTAVPSRYESVCSGTPERLIDTGGDGSTYTCTYRGCSLRFETTALLQGHKREGHRRAPGLNGADIAPGPRPTQAGPHKCDRINRNTGKPCNQVFSRPYDLTRHEDTIHNAGKQKARCDLCTEEKTFSRADALTRHNRACHSDVKVPDKRRRRGRPAGSRPVRIAPYQM